jgi:MraZ protein
MDAVAFIGLGHKFQIWAPDRLGPQLSEATGLLRSLRKRLGGQHAAGKPQGARER